MFTLHFSGQVQTFPTLKRTVNFLEDRKRVFPKPSGVYITDSKASANYTVPHPSSKKKAPIFVRTVDRTHELLLDAATRLVMAEPFKGLSFDQIVAEAGRLDSAVRSS